jgi:dihydroorotate dehydrogenase (NAD+) catalytic subunit
MGYSKVDLHVHIGKMVLHNPIILAPGPLGRTPVSMKRFARAGCGAVASKTLSSQPWKGNPEPKRVSLPNGALLNAEGAPNIGIQSFSDQLRKTKSQMGDCQIIVSVVGKTIEEFVSMAVKANKMGADIIDLDITCPNVGDKGKVDSWQKDLGLLEELIIGVKEAITVPLWIKFISAYGNLPSIAKTLEKAGVDAVVPFVSIGAMAIDIETGKPRLGFRHGVGVLTGAPLKYAELKAVADICRTVDIPVIATGGCSSGLDVIEFLMAGAKAVEMHTVFMREGVGYVQQMISQMTEFLEKKGISRIEELIGQTLQYLPEESFSFWYR